MKTSVTTRTLYQGLSRMFQLDMRLSLVELKQHKGSKTPPEGSARIALPPAASVTLARVRLWVPSALTGL